MYQSTRVVPETNRTRTIYYSNIYIYIGTELSPSALLHVRVSCYNYIYTIIAVNNIISYSCARRHMGFLMIYISIVARVCIIFSFVRYYCRHNSLLYDRNAWPYNNVWFLRLSDHVPVAKTDSLIAWSSVKYQHVLKTSIIWWSSVRYRWCTQHAPTTMRTRLLVIRWARGTGCFQRDCIDDC